MGGCLGTRLNDLGAGGAGWVLLVRFATCATFVIVRLNFDIESQTFPSNEPSRAGNMGVNNFPSRLLPKDGSRQKGW